MRTKLIMMTIIRKKEAIAEDWSTVLGTHVEWLTTACNSRYGGSYALFWPLWAPTLTYTYTYNLFCF